MVLQGNQVKLETFKKELRDIMEYTANMKGKK